MTCLSYASVVALLVLLAEGATAESERIEVEVRFLPDPPGTAGYSVWAQEERVHASPANDATTILVPECRPNTRIQIRPNDGRYSWPTYFCSSRIIAKVRYIHAAALLWNEADGSAAADYAEEVAPAFNATVAAAANGNENVLALRKALAAEDFAELAELSRAASDAADTAELTRGYHLIALDATFRSAGKDPTNGLIRFAEDLDTPVLTQEGDAVLAEFAPGWLPRLPIEGTSTRATKVVFGTGKYGRLVSVGSLTGLEVFDSVGEKVGHFYGFAADTGDDAIVDLDGSFGIGNRTVAIPLDALELGETSVTLGDLTIRDLEELPENDQLLLPANTAVEFRFDG